MIIASWDWADGWQDVPGITSRSSLNGPQSRVVVDGQTWVQLAFTGRDGSATLPANVRYEFDEVPERIEQGDVRGRDHVFLRYGFRSLFDVPADDHMLVGGKFPGFDGRWGYPVRGGYWQPVGGNGGAPGCGKFYPGGHRSTTEPVMCGWSARGQWWASAAPEGHQLADAVTLGSYLYHPDWDVLGTGDAREWNNVVLMPGERHTIEQEIRLNSITGPYDDAGNGHGQPDGILRAWVDGHLAYEVTDMVWTHHPYMGVQAAWIIFMHGGVRASLSTQKFELGPVVISDERIKR